MKALTTLRPFPTDGSIPTLGWAVVHWIETYLVQPDGDDAGEPFRLTPEQLNFVLWFYALDARGRFRNRRAVLRRAKGWGKSPFLGAICLAELLGPVRFGGWDADGEPIGVPHPAPWVNLAGVSETQTQNTMTVVLAMLENSPALEDYDLDVGLTRIFVDGGRGRLLPIAASSSTQEGARPSFAVMDETHHWTESNGGWKLARVIRRNLAKSRDGSARSIETTNAHEPGHESVAEASFQDHLAIADGRAKASGLLYDSREAPMEATLDLADEAALLAGLRCAYGDATWVDLERIRDEVYDPSTPPEEARRFYLNQIVAAADAWTDPGEYDANETPDLAPLKFAAPGEWRKGDTVVLGFDGGRTDDSTALLALRVSDGAPFLLGLWERPLGPAGNGWEVDHPAVRETVDFAFSTLDVVAFFSDVKEWETDVDSWRDEYGERLLVKATTRHAVAYDMRAHQADTTRTAEALARAITDGEAPWRAHDLVSSDAGTDGAASLRRHVLNARRRPNRFGVSFGKETRESTKKVDALAAYVLARMARTRVLGENVLSRRRGRVGRLVGY